MEILRNIVGWMPPYGWMKIETIEMHTGGEPLRVFVSGLPETRGNSILEKRKYFKENYDYIRTGTMWEPRGHADMYGAVLTDPVEPGSDFGVFFLHNEGYSTMCGHAIIALTKLVLDTGLVEKQGRFPELIIDAPPGKIHARAVRENSTVTKSAFLNVPSFVLLMDKEVEVPGLGRVVFDVAYGGAFYAFVEAASLGLSLIPSEGPVLVDLGRRIKKAVMDNFKIEHPFEEDLSFLYGVIFTGRPVEAFHHSRNVCIFADGELDRSATGSGVSARAALHYAKSELRARQKITIESILGTTMDVSIKELSTFGPYQAVIPEVSGKAYFTGKNTFYFDPNDPLKKGFLVR